VLAAIEGRPESNTERLEKLASRMGTKAENLSPAHHVRKGAPPTLLLHGKADNVVPYWTAEVFAAAMRKAGSRCELIGYEGQQHGFFNYGRGDNAHFITTTKKMDEFLTSLGYLKGPPMIEKFLESKSGK
jgi:acetyl esterase